MEGPRIAIMGTSYGGYGTVCTMEMYPDIFTAGIADSAVTDWEYYDPIYTQRYMGLLPDSAPGTRRARRSIRKRLKSHPLLIHSLLDDNVHPRHALQLFTALASAGKDLDARINPPGIRAASHFTSCFRIASSSWRRAAVDAG